MFMEQRSPPRSYVIDISVTIYCTGKQRAAYQGGDILGRTKYQKRRLSAEEVVLSNCGIGEDS